MFSDAFLKRARSHEQFLNVVAVLRIVVLLVVLWSYAKRGAGFMKQSAAGRVGTGMMLGMLGFGLVWLAQLPFDFAELWWERRHDIAHIGYLEFALDDFLALGGTFLSVSIALAVVMGIAGRLRQWWWLAAAPLFVAITFGQAAASPYLLPNLHKPRGQAIAADAKRLAEREGVPDARIRIQKTDRITDAPNAEATGLDGGRTVILWDTVVNGQFTRRQVDVILAHEFGHLARHHILRSVLWYALFLIPATMLVAFLTRRRGGLARPEAVPLALLIYVALQIATGPAQNAVIRHMETEADYRALVTTSDPDAARGAFKKLATASITDPAPPGWARVLFDSHPTIMQRIEFTEAWRLSRPGR